MNTGLYIYVYGISNKEGGFQDKRYSVRYTINLTNDVIHMIKLVHTKFCNQGFRFHNCMRLFSFYKKKLD